MTKQSSCVVSLKLLVGLAVLAIGLTSAQPSSAESSTQTFTEPYPAEQRFIIL